MAPSQRVADAPECALFPLRRGDVVEDEEEACVEESSDSFPVGGRVGCHAGGVWNPSRLILLLEARRSAREEVVTSAGENTEERSKVSGMEFGVALSATMEAALLPPMTTKSSGCETA